MIIVQLRDQASTTQTTDESASRREAAWPAEMSQKCQMLSWPLSGVTVTEQMEGASGFVVKNDI